MYNEAYSSTKHKFKIKQSNVIEWRKTKGKTFESISNIWSGKKFFCTWCNKGKKTWVNKKAVTKANFIYVMTFQKKSKEKNVRPSLAWFSSSNIHLGIFSGFWGFMNGQYHLFIFCKRFQISRWNTTVLKVQNLNESNYHFLLIFRHTLLSISNINYTPQHNVIFTIL